MTSTAKVEISCGLATPLVALMIPFAVNGMHTFDLFRSFPSLLEDALILSICPGLVVALGAYMHAVMQKSWGRVLLWIAGIFYAILSPLVFLSDAYHAGWSLALLGFTPAALAIVTLVFARKTFP